MSFFDVVRGLDRDQVAARLAAQCPADVERALDRTHLDEDDIVALFSPAASPYLEQLAQRSAALTRRRFGRTIQLYAPIYLSNECVNQCQYCGFAHHLQVARVTLDLAETIAEADVLHAQGFRHILLVSGESPRALPDAALLEVVRALRRNFHSISIEMGPMTDEVYRSLVEAGVDGVTMYQETYDQVRYREVHPAGPKASYERRLNTIERAGEAGFRALGVGALLGLGADWRFEAVMVALHARYLMRRFWKSRVGVSFPRIRARAGGTFRHTPVSDTELVHMLCATRLILPDSELVLSTREPAQLRDNLMPLGITRMSAGSSTAPGGYRKPKEGGEQFEVEDPRSPSEVAAIIESAGFEAVWKDQDRVLVSRISTPAAGG